ncbi:MAG: heme lyase NrfEFG subunit NrfE, partial [Gemmatimonadota bacterium]|nr:heme lyase NrfEFG subunit NrfE [Gemmatimonadota bacterium]
MSVYALGPIALGVGLALAAYGAVLGFLGGRRDDPKMVDAAVGSVYGSAACVALAYLLLTAAFLTDQFQFSYVA